MTESRPAEVQKYIEAKAHAAELARKQGTPKYDPRAHRAAVERERRAAKAIEIRDRTTVR